MALKLTRLHVKNFKSMDDTTVHLEDFNIIIGANNAGKTNLVDLLDFIQDAIETNLIAAAKSRGGFEKIKNFRTSNEHIEIKAIFKETSSQWIGIKTPEPFPYVENRDDEYALGFVFTSDKKYVSEIKIKSGLKLRKLDSNSFLELVNNKKELEQVVKDLNGEETFIEMEVSLIKSSVEISDPSLQKDYSLNKSNGDTISGDLEKYKKVSFRSFPYEHGKIDFMEGVDDESITILIKNKKDKKIDPRYYVALFSRFFGLDSKWVKTFCQGKLSVNEYVDHLKSNIGFEEFIKNLFRRDILTFNFDVRSIRRNMKPLQPSILERDGANLNYILQTLKSSDPEAFESISVSLTGVVEEVKDIEVKELPLGTDKIPEIFFMENGDFTVGRENISDGSLMLLAIMTAMYANETGAFLIVIEEPERHLHMDAISYLVEAFRAYSTETQLIITTQSSEVMRILEPKKDNIVFIFRDYNGITKTVSSKNIKELEPLLKELEYNVDDVVRTRILGDLGDFL